MTSLALIRSRVNTLSSQDSERLARSRYLPWPRRRSRRVRTLDLRDAQPSTQRFLLMPPPLTRDATRHPHDDIGDRLWSYAHQGDQQDVARPITFSVELPTVTTMARFIDDLDELFPERAPDHVHVQTLDVTVSLLPTHGQITEVLQELSELAEDHGASLMGWDYIPVT